MSKAGVGFLQDREARRTCRLSMEKIFLRGILEQLAVQVTSHLIQMAYEKSVSFIKQNKIHMKKKI